MSLDIVILAAGEGTRMKSHTPKVLHPLGGRPFVLYSVEAARRASQRPPVLVIGNGSQAVQETVGEAARYVIQAERLGTGHAVMQTREMLRGQSNHVIVLYADMPLLRGETLGALYEAQQAHDGPLSILAASTDTPRGFGRVIRREDSFVREIIEEAYCTPEQLAIKEVNVGVYCFEADWLWENLDRIPLNSKGEYFLTDMVGIAVEQRHRVNAIVMQDPDEAMGINNRVHLAEAEAALRKRIDHELMLSGVTILDPANTYIHPGVRIGADTTILPNTYIWGETAIGEECVIGPNALIESSTIGDRCHVQASVIEYATLEDNVEIGPFAHLRKGAYLESGVHMGNFGEVKNSRLHRGVKMGHFSYIGDADIGENTNIGAGTITCNYDGKNKHKTVTGKDVFIGSDTMLVAPVTLGDGSRTGAGSVVTRDVPPRTLVYGVPARPADGHAQDESQKSQEG